MRTAVLALAALAGAGQALVQQFPYVAVHTLGSVNYKSTQVEGAIWTGLDLTMYNMNAGNQTRQASDPVELVVGRNLALDGSGFVNGPAVYVGSYTPSNDFPLNGTATQVPVSPVNTTDYFVFYQNISVNYGMRQPNGQVVRVQDAVTLIGTDNHTNIFFFDSPYLESCTTLTIQAPNGSFAILNIPDEQNYARAFNVITQGPDFAHIIWNFYNSTTLEIDSIGLIGTVLAPFADVTFTTGQIQGSIFANSLTGSGAVLPPSPFTPFCPLIPICPCAQAWQTPLPSWSVYVLNDINMTQSTCAGNMAGGGDVSLSSFGECTSCNNTFGRNNTIVAGGDLTMSNAQAHAGNCAYGGRLSAPQWACADGKFVQAAGVEPFAHDFAVLVNLTADWDSLPATDPVSRIEYELTLRQISSRQVAIFDVDPTLFNECQQMTIIAPEQNYVIVNVPGATNKFSNFEVNLQGGVNQTQVLWIFPESTFLDIDDVDVQGSVLAPLANVSFTAGQLNGSIYANNLVGTGETLLMWPDPPPCVCPPPPPPCW